MSPGQDVWEHIRKQFELRNDNGREYIEKRAIAIIDNWRAIHFQGKYQCDRCEDMSQSAPAAGMQWLPCFGVRGKTCVACVVGAHRCSFTRDANTKKRKAKDPTPDESSDVESEPVPTRPTKARKADEASANKRVPEASPDDSSDDESALPLAQTGSGSRTASAAAHPSFSLDAPKTDAPKLNASTSETPKSETFKPEKSSLEDIQRYRRKLHRRLESSLAFLTKAQSELHPDGGRKVTALPDLLKEIVEDLDEVRKTAQGLLQDLE